jgi:hypothetical protein
LAQCLCAICRRTCVTLCCACPAQLDRYNPRLSGGNAGCKRSSSPGRPVS